LVAEACNGHEAIAQFRKYNPDVTLMDLQMPDMDGIDAMVEIRQSCPHAKIIVLPTFAGDALAQRALRAGAQGSMLKGLVRNDLLDTIRAVNAGRKRIHPVVAGRITQHLGQEDLSERELQVLELIQCGYKNKQIADRLSIVEATVNFHLANIVAKLQANDRTHAVTVALERGGGEPKRLLGRQTSASVYPLGGKPVHDGIDVCACSVNMRKVGALWSEDKREIGPSEKDGVQLFALDQGVS
jgi:DNA-binding NarL/FixJ family response regulator